MSDTPRTDAHCKKILEDALGLEYAATELQYLAEKLEEELAAAQAEITALRDAEPVAWEYWREVGISEEERIVTKQPPELMQQVEIYQYRPLYALPAAAIEQRDKALEEAAKVCDRLRNKNYSSEEWVAGTDDCAAAIRAMKESAP